MLIYLTVLIAAVTIFKPEGIQSQQQCRPSMKSNDADDFNYSRVSCDFEDYDDRLCGWKNIEGYQMAWTTAEYDSNGYAHLDVAYHRKYDKGRLVSPWLDPKPGYKCQLEFRYFSEKQNRCKLSLIREAEAPWSELVLWNTSAKSLRPFSKPIHVDVACAVGRYRIIFEGERISNSYRNWYWKEIDVEDVVYHVCPDDQVTSLPSTESTTAQTSETTTRTSSSNHPTSVSLPLTTPSSSVTTIDIVTTPAEVTVPINNTTAESAARADTSADGLDAGPLAAIVIAAVVVSFLVAVVLIVVVRRRRNDDAKTKKRSIPDSASTSVSGAVTGSVFESDDLQIPAAIGGPPVRFKGGNAHRDHVLTAPEDHYVNVSNDNDSPHRGYELAALPSSSKDSSTNRYTRLRLKGSKGTALSDQVDDDTYDHAEARQGREHPTAEDEYTVPHQNRKFKPSVPAKGNTVSKSAAAKGSAVYENAAVESSIAYQNAADEDYDRVRVLADRKQSGDGDYSLANNVHTSDAAEAAAAYALAGTTDYETVDDDGRLVTSPSSASGDVYNRLNAKGGPAVGQKAHQNHYDHINDPAGTGAEYSSLGLEEKTRYLQREMAEGDYSHI